MEQRMSDKDDYLDKYSKKTLSDMHKDAYESLDIEENYNYDDGETIIHWKPVAKDVEFPVGTFKMAQLMETPVYFIGALKGKNDTYKIYLKKFSPLQSKKDTLTKMENEYVEFIEQLTIFDPLQFYHFYGLFV